MNFDLNDIKCPISKCIFLEPVLGSDGIVYEKDRIMEWLETRKTSPMTNKKFDKFEVKEIISLKNFIDTIVEKYPELKKERYERDQSEIARKKIKNIIRDGALDKLVEIKPINLKMILGLAEDADNVRNLVSNQKVIRHCIDNCEDINDTSYGEWTLMHLLCYNDCSIDTIKYVFEKKKPNIELKTDAGKTVIEIACGKSSLKVVQYLLDHGAQLSSELLLQLCARSNDGFVQFVKDNKFDMYLSDKNGNTLAHTICKIGSVNEVKALINSGYDLTIDNLKGATPLHLLAARDSEYFEIVKTIINNNKYAMLKDKSGVTVLQIACQMKIKTLIQYLVTEKFDMIVQNNCLNLIFDNVARLKDSELTTFMFDKIHKLLNDNKYNVYSVLTQ